MKLIVLIICYVIVGFAAEDKKPEPPKQPTTNPETWADYFQARSDKTEAEAREAKALAELAAQCGPDHVPAYDAAAKKRGCAPRVKQ